MRVRSFQVLAGLVFLGSVGSCGGKSSPSSSTTPTTPTPPPQAQVCRTYATTYTISDTRTGGSATQNVTCTFQTGPRQLVCQFAVSDSFCGNSTTNQTTSYASVDDFVDEVAGGVGGRILNQGLQGSRTGTGAPVGCAASGSWTSTNSFDAQRRPTQMVFTSGPATVTTTYTQWDSLGRPTRATISGGTTNVWTYDDANRTVTLVQTSPSSNATNVLTYDANVNGVRSVTTAPGSTQTLVFTNSTTAQVCK